LRWGSPLPIPNREVKPNSADGTTVTGGRVCHRHFSKNPWFRQGFFVLSSWSIHVIFAQTLVTNNGHQPPMKHSIALKIFSLAVGVLIMMIVTAVLNSIQVIHLGDQVRDISGSGIPIAKHAAALNENGLRRRIAFDRLLREYQIPVRDSIIVQAESANFEKFTLLLNQNIDSLRLALAHLPDNRDSQELYIRAREITTEIEGLFLQQTDMARRLLMKEKDREYASSVDLMEINFQSQVELQNKRNELEDVAIQIANASVYRATLAEQRVLWSSLVVTLLSLILGLWGAWFLSKRLANPIMRLVRSTEDVHDGNLSVTIEGLPEDEIGQLGDSMNRMIEELRKKQDLQAVISTYIDPRVVQKIILPGRAEVLAGQKQIMTILFCDIAGFTGISERLSPTGLVKMVNRYFTIMTECIQAEGGIIDKFIGDAIMAYWGPPFIGEGEQAAAACRAALRQREALELFRKELPEILGLRKDIPEINIRIGLATGEVVVGNIGSDTARSYTVMGDIVNLASRLESANKQYGTSIIISEATMLMADLHVEVMELDRIVVKGKSETVEIYELLGLRGQLSETHELRRKRFNEALDAYRRQDWMAANAVFSELVENFNDKTASAFLYRIRLLETHSLGAGWDGVWRMTSK
jgi:adenylate cyclase